jgi:hypothetical protein
MNMQSAVWREAKDDMGRSVWLNLSLARSIRRDPKGRGTWVTFDNEHTVSVETTVEDLVACATPTQAKRPRDL